MLMKKTNNKYRNNNNNNNNNQIYSLNYKFDSTSIAGKFCGTALDLIKRYNELAKEAHSNNNYVEMEVFRQYAEHYRKIVTDINEKKGFNQVQNPNQNNRPQFVRENSENTDGENSENCVSNDNSGNENCNVENNQSSSNETSTNMANSNQRRFNPKRNFVPKRNFAPAETVTPAVITDVAPISDVAPAPVADVVPATVVAVIPKREFKVIEISSADASITSVAKVEIDQPKVKRVYRKKADAAV